MFEKALALALLVLVTFGSYGLYKKITSKAANWQVETLNLRQQCSRLLADTNRSEKDVVALTKSVEKLSWKTHVSDQVIKGVAEAADPVQENAIGAGKALDQCLAELQGAI